MSHVSNLPLFPSSLPNISHINISSSSSSSSSYLRPRDLPKGMGTCQAKDLKYRIYCRVVFTKEAKTTRGKSLSFINKPGSLISRSVAMPLTLESISCYKAYSLLITPYAKLIRLCDYFLPRQFGWSPEIS
jgi:hypothetical protein